MGASSRTQLVRPLPAVVAARACKKRYATALLVVFACVWLAVLRFGMRVSRRGHTRAPKAARGGGAQADGRAYAFARLLYEGEAGILPQTDAGAPYANDVNDMGTCGLVGVGGAAAKVSSAVAKPPPPGDAAWLLCSEVLRAAPWYSAASSSSGGAAGPVTFWPSPVCGYLARELQAASGKGGVANKSLAVGGAEVQRSKHGSSGSGGGVVEGGGGSVPIDVCDVTVSAADVVRLCGAAVDPVTVPVTRTINPYSRDAPRTFFLWNKALAAACDASPSLMVDDGRDINDSDYLPHVESASTYYVVTTALQSFANKVVPSIKRPFVIVSGSSDDGAPLQNWGWSLTESRALLENPLLIGWFAQNPDYLHRKIVPLHIGLDYHTIARPELESHSWGTPSSAGAQDATLRDLRCSLPPFSARPITAVMNFKTAGRGVRDEVYNLLKDRPGIAVVGGISRAELWRRYGEFSFVISPRGYGRDCHRTWEALSLGCAVIVSADAHLEHLYADLPIIHVANWDTVTAENLAKWHGELAAKWHTFRFEKLRLDFWLSAVNTAVAQGSLQGIWSHTTNAYNFSKGELVWGRAVRT